MDYLHNWYAFEPIGKNAMELPVKIHILYYLYLYLPIIMLYPGAGGVSWCRP